MLQLFLVVETIQHIPNVADHLLRSLAIREDVSLGNGILVVIAEDGNEACYGGTARDALRHSVVELIGLVAIILDVLIFPLARNGLGYVFKVELGLALSEEHGLCLFKLFLRERTEFNILRAFNLDVVHKRQHPEEFERRMRVGHTGFLWLKGTLAHALPLALQRALEIQGLL